jgi:hypothetical protein
MRAFYYNKWKILQPVDSPKLVMDTSIMVHDTTKATEEQNCQLYIEDLGNFRLAKLGAIFDPRQAVEIPRPARKQNRPYA